MATPVVLEPTMRQKWTLLAVVATVIAAAALWLWPDASEQEAIRELPQAERRELYERTLRTLETSCNPRSLPEGLEAFCRDQSEFIVQFPECEGSCRAIAKPHRSVPTR